MTDGGDGIGIVAVFDAGGDDKIAGRLGCVVGARTVLRHHSGGEVGAVEAIVERLAGGTHQSDL